MRNTLIAIIAAAAAAFGAWQTPVNLGPPVNSAYGDWYPVVTRDGATMFFVSTRPGGYGNGDIWRSTKTGGVWQTPVNCGANVNSTGLDTGLALDSVDTRLYFASDAAGTLGSLDIWWAPINGGAVGPKVHIGAPISSQYRECCPIISADAADLYFSTDMPGGLGGHDMYVAHWTGSGWGTPVNLGAPNSAYNDCPRWVSDDGLTLAFLSWRPGGQGECDLYYSTKAGGAWGEAVNMGSVINTAAVEFGPWFYCNHGAMTGVMYYGSTRPGGLGDFDIWTTADDAAYNVIPASIGRVKAGFK